MSEDNIYQAPDSDTEVNTEKEHPMATRTQRFLTLIFDYFGFLMFALGVGFSFGIIGLGEVITEMNETVLGLLIMLAYYTSLEFIWGVTLGKLIMGTKVVRMDGSKISFGQALGRSVCRFIPFEWLSFLRERPNGLHDSLAKTKVISTRK